MIPNYFAKKPGWFIILIMLMVSYVNASVGSNWIEQWGIRWTFDKNISTDGSAGTYRYGTFANGDYWIVATGTPATVKITDITPRSVVENGITRHGTMINPKSGAINPNFGNGKHTYQGFDSRLYNYDISYNKGRPNGNNISVSNPMIVSTGSSIVSAKSTLNATWDFTNHCLLTVAVLTILDQAPSANSFRPGYSGDDKSVKFNATNLDYTKLGQYLLSGSYMLPLIQGTGLHGTSDDLYQADTLERMVERPWLDFAASTGGTYMHPQYNCAFDGGALAGQVSQIALTLNSSNYTNEQKKKLFIGFTQIGIDNYSIHQGTNVAWNTWENNGQIGAGRKFPILFAGMVLNDSAMSDIGANGNLIRFAEDEQTFYITQYDIDHYSVTPVSPQVARLPVNDSVVTYYTNEHLGMPEWGIMHYDGPQYDNLNWVGAPYRTSNGPYWGGFILAAHMMHMESLWNHQALFDYMDRYMSISPDQSPSWVTTAWTAHRAGLGSVWPDTGTVPTTYTLSISVTNGSVTKSPDKTSYNSGEAVILTAAPNTGYTFGSWTGSVTGTTNPVTVTMNSNKSVTANFTQASATMPTDTVYQNTTETIFSGASDYQAISTSGWKISGTTITLWANPSNITGSRYILGHTIAGTWSNRIQLWLSDSALGLGLGGTHSTQANLATLQTGQWYFISLSWNGTNYTVQVNGQTVGTGSYTGLTTLETFADIGNNGSAASRTEPFAGTIDDVRIYGRALSNAEITAIYNNGRTTSTPTTYTLSVTAANGTVAKSPNTATYTYGQVVTLTATANAGYSFGSWTGDATGSTNPVTVTMNGNKVVTANFTQNTYTLAITTANGTVAKSPNTATYTFGQVVILTATANAGYSFGSWTGDATGTTNPVTITMNGNKTVTANFTQNTYTLSITAANGTVAKSPNTATYTYGQVVTLTATANTGYGFGSWTGDATGTSNPVTITMNGNKAVTANFTQNTYTLTTTATNGMVAKSPNTATYTYGQVVTLTATANTGYGFGSWTGDATGSTNPVTVTMNGNKAVTANFTQNTYTLSVTAANGTVAKSPNTATYTYGQVVTLTATANTGYSFGSWTGDATGTTSPVTVTINGNKAVTANFTALSMAESMTAHWMLDENTGSTVTDSTSAGRTAALINSPSWGYAWANEDWVSMANQTQAIAIPAAALNPQAGSVAVWVEPDSVTGTQFILGHIFNGGNRICLYSVAGKLALGLGSTAILKTNIADLTIGQAVHIALTWSGTTYAVYVNAVQKTTGTFEGLTALNTTLDIGNYGDPASRTLGFVGVIEDIRTYCRALTALEIQRLYDTYDVHQQKPITFSLPATYQSNSLPAGAKFQNGVFTWQPWYNQIGNYTVVFTATGQPIRVMTITVHNAPLTDWYRQFLVRTGKL